MKNFEIPSLSRELEIALAHKINFKTKPLGALGRLEEIAKQIGLIQNSLSPSLNLPHLLVFAGDHGIAKHGVSAYPQEVTYQMVMNFLNDGAAINVFCRQNNIQLKIVNAGVNYEFPQEIRLINTKMGNGTKSFLHEMAMAISQAELCIDHGAQLVQSLFKEGCNVIGFGEMGIGNTSSASALMSAVCNIPLHQCIGKGTGLDETGLQNKLQILEQASAYHGKIDDPLKILATFGGFEIAQMCGAMLQAAENKMLLLIDGFIASSAFLVASKICPSILDYALFCHQSNEAGHAKLLQILKVRPLLNLELRLGEGTGVAIAFPIIQSAVNFLNEMASFESAGVSTIENV